MPAKRHPEDRTFLIIIGQVSVSKIICDVKVIKDIMSRQIASMVKWYDIINKMRDNGVTQFIEVGPKKVLTGLMKKILPKDSGCKCFQVDSPESLSKCVDALT